MKKYIEEQKKFQEKLYDLKNFSFEDKVKLSKDFILAAHKELSEVLDCLPWKTHIKEDKLFVGSNLKEEIVDVFKYLTNLLVIWDISSEEFDEAYDAKTEVVKQRHLQEFLKEKRGEKVCAIDLDDVLNEWEYFFVKTYNKKNKTKYKNDLEIRQKENPMKYSEFKHWWRESGIKRNIPVKKGASELTLFLKKKGYRIIIISSRPYKEYFRIFSDTIYWLKANKIAFDDLYFEENKHLKILKHFPSLKFMIEDNEHYANQVADAGYKVYLLSKNVPLKLSDKIKVITNLSEVKQYV